MLYNKPFRSRPAPPTLPSPCSDLTILPLIRRIPQLPSKLACAVGTGPLDIQIMFAIARNCARSSLASMMSRRCVILECASPPAHSNPKSITESVPISKSTSLALIPPSPPPETTNPWRNRNCLKGDPSGMGADEQLAPHDCCDA